LNRSDTNAGRNSAKKRGKKPQSEAGRCVGAPITNGSKMLGLKFRVSMSAANWCYPVDGQS